MCREALKKAEEANVMAKKMVERSKKLDQQVQKLTPKGEELVCATSDATAAAGGGLCCAFRLVAVGRGIQQSCGKSRMRTQQIWC